MVPVHVGQHGSDPLCLARDSKSMLQFKSVSCVCACLSLSLLRS